PPRERAHAVKLRRRGRLELAKLTLTPVGLIVPAARLLALEVLLRAQQRRIARLLRDRVVLLLPAQDLDVVLVGDGDDVAAIVELRPAGAAEDLLGRARVDKPLLPRGPLHQ